MTSSWSSFDNPDDVQYGDDDMCQLLQRVLIERGNLGHIVVERPIPAAPLLVDGMQKKVKPSEDVTKDIATKKEAIGKQDDAREETTTEKEDAAAKKKDVIGEVEVDGEEITVGEAKAAREEIVASEAGTTVEEIAVGEKNTTREKIIAAEASAVAEKIFTKASEMKNYTDGAWEDAATDDTQ